MKATVFGLAVLFLFAICQRCDADLQKPIPISRFRRSPQDNQAKLHIQKHGNRPATLNADYNRQLYDDGRHMVHGNAGVSSPDLRHFNPSAGVNYEYRPQKNVVLSAQTGVAKTPSGNFEGQGYVGLGVDW